MPRRGRPPKFGRPGHVVSVTLPDDALRLLNQVDPDTGWAIVKLLEREPKERRATGQTRTNVRHTDIELARISARRSLIVVSRDVFKSLPGVNLIPLDEHRAFLALEAGRGMSDLELAVIDGLADTTIGPRDRKALESLRRQLAAWRRDRRLLFHTRSIIVIEEEGPGSRRNGVARRPRETESKAS